MSTIASTSTRVDDAKRSPAVVDRLDFRGRDRPIVVLLAFAAVVRAATMALYFPAVMMSFDSPRYARVSPPDIFGDYWAPAGYPAFLKALHLVSDQVWFSIAAQHLIGLAVGGAVYVACRRLGASPAPSTVAAAIVLLSGDVLYLEHWLMSDALMLDLTILALVFAIYGLVPRIRWRWLFVSGSLAAAAALSRSVGIAVFPIIAVCAAAWAGPPPRRRLRSAISVLAGAALIFGAYVLAFEIKNGRYLGLTNMTGWNLYARVAPFADCSRFEPPRETRVLCERTDPEARVGALGYYWDTNSVARRNFELGPETAATLGQFARQALLHQPGDYAVAVGTDLLRYVEPSAGLQRGYSGQSRDLVSFGFRDPGVEKVVTQGLAPRYDGTRVSAPGVHTLAVYQQLFRVDRLVLLLALVLSAMGGVLLRGPMRLGVALFALTSVALYVLPTLTVTYDFRYGIPSGVMIGISGVLACAGLVARRRERASAAS